jgi:hypothetical protein
MDRDFREMEVDPGKRLYEPKITRQANVIPEYLFWNSQSTFYNFGTPAVPGASGRVVLSAPLGSISDPNAKIFAFKHHLATQAVDLATQYLIPNKTGVLFQTGDVAEAIRQGAAAVGWSLSAGYGYVETERYLGIFHEVAPASQALVCDDCHNGGSRLNFTALGYDPKVQRNGKPLCASCHGDKSDKWPPSEFFIRVHDKHVRDKRVACSECHAFPAP